VQSGLLTQTFDGNFIIDVYQCYSKAVCDCNALVKRVSSHLCIVVCICISVRKCQGKALNAPEEALPEVFLQSGYFWGFPSFLFSAWRYFSDSSLETLNNVWRSFSSAFLHQQVYQKCFAMLQNPLVSWYKLNI